MSDNERTASLAEMIQRVHSRLNEVLLNIQGHGRLTDSEVRQKLALAEVGLLDLKHWLNYKGENSQEIPSLLRVGNPPVIVCAKHGAEWPKNVIDRDCPGCKLADIEMSKLMRGVIARLTEENAT